MCLPHSHFTSVLLTHRLLSEGPRLSSSAAQKQPVSVAPQSSIPEPSQYTAQSTLPPQAQLHTIPPPQTQLHSISPPQAQAQTTLTPQPLSTTTLPPQSQLHNTLPPQSQLHNTLPPQAQPHTAQFPQPPPYTANRASPSVSMFSAQSGYSTNPTPQPNSLAYGGTAMGPGQLTLSQTPISLATKPVTLQQQR